MVAARVQMTQMPELVAGFHSLVGLAAVFIGLNADIEAGRAAAAVAAGTADQLRGFAATLAHKTPVELSIMRVEIFLGILIGAITFTGSIVAYGKLAGKIASKPLTLPMPPPDQHRRRRCSASCSASSTSTAPGSGPWCWSRSSPAPSAGT